jgi:hypothetical protein
VSLSCKYAEEVHPTAFVRDNTASYSAAAKDAGSTAGNDVGRWRGASSFVYVTRILGRSFPGKGCSVGFLRQAPALSVAPVHRRTWKWCSPKLMFSTLHYPARIGAQLAVVLTRSLGAPALHVRIPKWLGRVMQFCRNKVLECSRCRPPLARPS